MESHRELSAKQPVVVVVDDDAAVRNSLKFALEIEGYSVRTYADGAALMSADDLSECACLIIDQNMPGGAGLDVVANLRQRAIAVPAILITSHPNVALSRRARSAGIPIVEKPLLTNALIESVRGIAREVRPGRGGASPAG